MRHANPAAFKEALEHRVKARAKARGISANRYRQLVIFERFLERVYGAVPDALVLKGGFALELRLERARTTKDIDARVTGNLKEICDAIVDATRGQEELLSFDHLGGSDLSEMVGEQVVYDGRRLYFRAKLANKPYGSKFGLDLAMADAMLRAPDEVMGDDIFEFVGREPLRHPIYPPETHLAEKLHALTFPRSADRPNSRVKDLVDIGLLAQAVEFDATSLRQSVEATFSFRGTHEIPAELPPPPRGWEVLYKKMRDSDDLPWLTVDDLNAVAVSFASPLLGKEIYGATWNPNSLLWLPSAG